MPAASEEMAQSDSNRGGTLPIEMDNNIVISGIAGRFPESNNMKILQENLFNKVDLVTDDDRRWEFGHPEIPQRTGKVNNINKFDAEFFNVDFVEAHTMDPMSRMVLEHAYEAILDAGVNPITLRGSNTGVFIGACFAEATNDLVYRNIKTPGTIMAGCSRSKLSNGISYWLGVHGPSYVVDTACSSSLFALENAYAAMKNGICDSALVGGSNLCLHPNLSFHFARLGVLSHDGRCKVFDKDANGYVRSETIGMIFLQKAKDAKRIYAHLVHAKTNCDGYKEQGITYPSGFIQSVLLEEFYQECGLSPTILSYIEAHGTGTSVGDPEEVETLGKIFCPGRKTPLKIGSVKSNLGHTEPSSGICSIAKVIIAMETGYIAPNLHLNNLRKDIKALSDGSFEVVTELTPFDGGYIGLNSFGFGGGNAHILLNWNEKEKINGGAPEDDLPRLIVVSGRTAEAVTTLLNDIESRPADVEYIRLLHDIHEENIPRHTYRGHIVVPPRGLPDSPRRNVQYYSGTKRPIWFVFSGLGSQWAGMGEALLQIPVFAKAVKKCDAVLKPHGVDVTGILTNRDKKTFDSILNSFVGIAAVQIGLVDVLASVGILPDRIIGHSVGELVCAYADGCLTTEQTILCAYFRGLAFIEAKINDGLIADVGLGYKQLKNSCPPDIEIACHNSLTSSTISGPEKLIEPFLARLQAEGTIVKRIPSSKIPYHSRYIAAAGPKLRAYLQKIIPDPKLRSPKWLSTSVPRSEWTSASARLSSAEYHTNTLLSPVLFEETLALIPRDAITVEIAPYALLQASFRDCVAKGVTNVALMEREHKNNVEVVLGALGNLYELGLQPQLKNLYPEVQLPVSRGTPMISPLLQWDHSENWYVTTYTKQKVHENSGRVVSVTLTDDDYEFMAGHAIDGRILLPATGYLSMIWHSVCMMNGTYQNGLSVVFEDVRFLRATTIPKEGTVELKLLIQKGSGKFEVEEGGAAVVTGYIHIMSDSTKERLKTLPTADEEEEEQMSSKDVYKELRLRGYHYAGLFRGIKSANVKGTQGRIAWDNNWVAFMDNMLQMQILGTDSRGLFVPTGIQKLVIDVTEHIKQLRTMPFAGREFPVRVIRNLGVIIAGGVEIHGLKASAIARKKPAGDPILEEYRFITHRDQDEISLRSAIRLAVHLALENHLSVKVKTFELVNQEGDVTVDDLLSPMVLDVLSDLPLIQGEASVVAQPDKFEKNASLPNIAIVDSKKLRDANALLAIGRRLLSSENSITFKQLLSAVAEQGFLLTTEALGENDNIIATAQELGLDVLLEKHTKDELVILLRKKLGKPKKTVVVKVNNEEFSWLSELKAAMEVDGANGVGGTRRILFVGQGDFENGLIGLVNCLRKEPGGEAVRGLLIQDPEAPEFSLEDSYYSEQLQLDLAVNVLQPGKKWGSYRHLLLGEPTPKLVNHAWVSQLVRGDLSSLRWLEGPIQSGSKDEKLVRIHYASLNFRDVMLTTGKLAAEVVEMERIFQDYIFGFEYSGIDVTGRFVMGMKSRMCMANMCYSDVLRWDVPDGWTLEDAATVPCVYGTCYYALYLRAKMKKGEKILIHSGSGGVGQAAITLALNEGCEVFTTVGTVEKRNFIKETFPQIDDNHIGNSRDTSFEQLILKETRGRGVDIVLNSLAEEKLLASVRCLSKGGRFLEIGKFDLAANTLIGLEMFRREISFHGILLDNFFQTTLEKKMVLKRLIDEGLKSGAIKPLNSTVFPKDQIEAAFRYMAAGKHIGKVLIQVRDKSDPPDNPILALTRFACSEDRCYVILGGLGGFGLELADWLVLRGAKKLVLTSRKGVSNGYQRMRIRLWRSYGTKVVVVSGKDAATRQGCKDILDVAASLGPVDAIFNLAVVLKDCLWENQTPETFAESFGAKAWSTKHLDQLSREICPQLRHFVVFSSVSCGRGNAGQTNYGMANSVMERICEKRVAEGLPGLAIQWGAVGEVGLVAEMMEDHKELVIGGTLQQRISSCLQELDGFLQQDSPIVASMVVAEKKAGGAGMDMVSTVLNIMGLKDAKSFSYHTPLAELGMDSMMAVEIKQVLERDFEVFLTAQDIRGLNFAKLSQLGSKPAEDERKHEVTGEEQVGDLAGIQMLFRVLGNEDFSSEVCLKLPSREEGSKSEVFLVPGVDGYGSIFEPLAKRSKSSVFCLRYGAVQVTEHTPMEIADRLLPYVLARRKNSRDLVITGYSYGASIAIELVRRLEADGVSARLVLVDGAPEQLRTMIEHNNLGTTDEQLQNDVLRMIMDVVAPTRTSELLVELEKCSSWEEKLKIFLEKAPTDSNLVPAEHQVDMCNAFYNRITNYSRYQPSSLPKIRSPIVLLRPTLKTVSSLPEDYLLGQLTHGKVDVHYVEGDHVTMLHNARVAAAIDGELLLDAQPLNA